MFAITESRPGSLLEPLSLRALKRFPVKVEQDAVWIDPQPLDEATPLRAADKQPTYVVLGTGAGGSAAIKARRENGFTGRLVMVEREKQAPYDRTALSKFVPQGYMDINDVPSLLPESYYQQQQIERINGNVEKLDSKRHRLRLEGGKTLSYERLLLATGATPQRPDLPGKALRGVQVLLSWEQTATRFFHDLPLNDDGSLTVDRTMKVSEDIYAIGDIATFPLDGNPTRIEHWRVAQQHGRVAAGAMMDKPQPYDAVPFFWTQHYGGRYEYLGHAAKWEQQEIIGSPDEDNFVSLYGLKGNLVAVVAAGRMRTTGVLLIKMGKKISFAEAQRIVADTREAKS
ncbi:MAG: FAD-dependent oxidoreductase [Sodalis sp. (in: enterobacteria)]|uniref:FAD-dependent oxidoreductase n=1 Tax=Sodalis sp. (in: enterobacteria) TaxID=1898979 RepID=UPI0039E6F348